MSHLVAGKVPINGGNDILTLVSDPQGKKKDKHRLVDVYGWSSMHKMVTVYTWACACHIYPLGHPLSNLSSNIDTWS